jgi:hypothetical protein
MALQLSTTITDENGLSVDNGYVNIQNISYRKSGSKLEVRVNVFKDQTSRNEGKAPVMRKIHRYDATISDLESIYLFTLAYGLLKSDDYPGASDV